MEMVQEQSKNLSAVQGHRAYISSGPAQYHARLDGSCVELIISH